VEPVRLSTEAFQMPPARVWWRAALRRPMMVTRIDRLVSGNRGALAGDILCLATIAFIFAIVLGIVG
jgi:hypothetical protein